MPMIFDISDGRSKRSITIINVNLEFSVSMLSIISNAGATYMNIASIHSEASLLSETLSTAPPISLNNIHIEVFKLSYFSRLLSFPLESRTVKDSSNKLRTVTALAFIFLQFESFSSLLIVIISSQNPIHKTRKDDTTRDNSDASPEDRYRPLSPCLPRCDTSTNRSRSLRNRDNIVLKSSLKDIVPSTDDSLQEYSKCFMSEIFRAK
mmetsp:Transcript_12283/g.23011  ORF Transcript_12283/g.23011 Transcript_12283/m.23011 type:complete len:208 (-) Transcript_12283:1081-1704(-)